jgi:hypothetical protein
MAVGATWVALRCFPTLLAVANTINTVARIITEYVGDRLGRRNTSVMALLSAAGSIDPFIVRGNAARKISLQGPATFCIVVVRGTRV